MANFAAAVYKDPSNYWNEHCFAAQNQTLHWSDDVSLLADDSDANNGCSGYHEVDWGIFVYFFLGSLVLVGCLLGFSRIEPLRKQLESTTVTEESEDIMRGYQRTGSSLRGVELLRSQEDEQNEPESENISGRPTSQSYLLAGASSEDDADPPSAGMLHAEEDSAPPDDILNVLLLVRGPTACIFLTFVVTLALFPGWTSELASVRQCQIHFRLANDLYTPFSFVLFNIGDLTGRLLAGHVISQRLLSNRLVKASLLRLVFFPLLFLCTGVGMSNPNGPLSLQIHSDVFSLAVQFAFSVSNGMLLTTAFATAPSLLPRDNDKMNERMSEILSFAVAVGLLAGGLCSFPVSRLTE